MRANFQILLLVVLTCVTGIVHAQSGVQVSSDQDGRVSVRANNVSASELASELSQQLGIRVVVTGDSEARVNLDIVEEPIEKALGKLSPNHMLVLNDDASEVVEVVLMMGEGQSNAGGAGPEQFLPSGSPAEAVIDRQAMGNEGSDARLEEERAELGRRAAANASANPDLPAAQLPPMFGDESANGFDPTTGLPYEEGQQPTQ